MTSTASSWPDVHDVLTEVLADLTEQEVMTVRLPADLQDRLPLQRVRRIGGTNDGTTDVARVDIEVYAASYEQGRDLAAAQQQLVERRRIRTSFGMVDRGSTEVAPIEVPYPDERIRMWRGTYQLALRRRPATYTTP